MNTCRNPPALVALLAVLLALFPVSHATVVPPQQPPDRRDATAGGTASAQALYDRAWRFYCGADDLPGDLPRAVATLRQAADLGLAVAQYSLSWFYRDGEGVERDLSASAGWMRRAAEQGHRDAQYSLSWVYRDGTGAPRDREQALKWLRLAAEQDHAEAGHALGWAYYSGDGVVADRATAFGWFLRAALLGHTRSQTLVGAAYLLGRGVAQDALQAYRWFDLAATAGDPDARRGRDRAARRLGADQLVEARRLGDARSPMAAPVPAPVACQGAAVERR